MKLCTRMTVVDGAPSDVLDISIVDDDHTYGLSDDRTELHIPGRVIGDPSEG